MKIEVEPSLTRPDGQNDENKQDLPPTSILEVWDTRGQRRWHEDMRNIGLRMLEEKISLPQEIPDQPQPRSFWALIPQAYEILRGTAYFREQRGSDLLKAKPRH